MLYANKKISTKPKLAEQTAKIISNVNELESKGLIKLEADTVFLDPRLWKDKISALNWINCLFHFYVLKRQLKPSAPLYFKHIETGELIGSLVNKKPKVLIFN